MNKIFQMHLHICRNCDKFFAVISRKYKKLDIFDISMATILVVNIITN